MGTFPAGTLYFLMRFKIPIGRDRVLPRGTSPIANTKNPACLVSIFLVNFSQMENTKKKEEVFQTLCPCCQSLLKKEKVEEGFKKALKRVGKGG